MEADAVTTVGIDLAAQPEHTALCALDWRSDCAVVRELRLGADDDELVAACRSAACTAIDAPFGWPRALVRNLAAWERNASWPSAPSRELRYRATDLHVQEVTGLWPLSPSADRIGVCAWRCAALLAALGVTDRLGGDGVVEAYPAAALKAWQLPHRGYKSRRGRNPATAALAGALRARTAKWLVLDERQWELCGDQHDALDSLVCALVARASMRGRVLPPPARTEDVVAEGWIQVPTPTSLDRLA